MTKTWSISTTVRNPDRILGFLETLAQFEGRVFDVDCQIDYQTALIQRKLYRPTNLSPDFSRFYDDPGLSMPEPTASAIFDHMAASSTVLRESPGLRGRTSAAPLAKMGLAIAKQSSGAVVITDLGKAFIEQKIDFGDIFFRFLLKWQYPNPDSTQLTAARGFDIKPFIVALHIVKRVNDAWASRGKEPKGVSRDEFNFFIQSTISYVQIDSAVEGILRHRTSTDKERETLIDGYLIDVFDVELDDLATLKYNLGTYGDNTRRYFRLTRFFYIRGNGYYFDLEPRRKTEISKLLETFDGSSDGFTDIDRYLTYLADVSQPFLPWETNAALSAILDELKSEIDALTNKIKAIDSEAILPSLEISPTVGLEDLKMAVSSAKQWRHELQTQLTHLESQNDEKFEKYILELETIHTRPDKPLNLEYLASLALFALNDALRISPNYLAGDDNLPIFTAPAGVPDIECFYDDFNLICEVTMLRNRSQWFNEGQPVMRHLRDFETRNPGAHTYCLFIAPSLHRDTINTFWTACKYEYEGEKMKIIPVSLDQFVSILKYVLQRKRRGKAGFGREEIRALLDEIANEVDVQATSTDWLTAINVLINAWGERVVNVT